MGVMERADDTDSRIIYTTREGLEYKGSSPSTRPQASGDALSSPTSTVSSATNYPTGTEGISRGTIVGIVLGGLATTVLLLLLVWMFQHRRRASHRHCIQPVKHSVDVEIRGFDSRSDIAEESHRYRGKVWEWLNRKRDR